MEPVQYKGYRIELKYYPAFSHSRREYSARCEYNIFDGDKKIGKGYDLITVEDAIAEAKEFIDDLVFTIDGIS